MELLDWLIRIFFMLALAAPIVIAVIWGSVKYWKRLHAPRQQPKVVLTVPSAEETARSVSRFRDVTTQAKTLGFFSNQQDRRRLLVKEHAAEDYYSVLQVQSDAAPQIIKSAFRTLMSEMKMHPDVGGFTERAMKINEAYAALSDPEKRREYDRNRNQEGFR